MRLDAMRSIDLASAGAWLRDLAVDGVVADAVVTDPPYGIGMDGGRGWDGALPVEWFADAIRVVRPGGRILIHAPAAMAHRVSVAGEDAGCEVEPPIQWLRLYAKPAHRTKLKPTTEPIVVLRTPGDPVPLRIDAARYPHGSRGWPGKTDAESYRKKCASVVGLSGNRAKVYGDSSKPRTNAYSDAGRLPGTVFDCPRASTIERAGVTHPTIKPLHLVRWLLRLVTPPGGTVLDPFAGSGTTLLAAYAEGVRARACDDDVRAIRDAIVRWNARDEIVADVERRLGGGAMASG